MLLLSGYLACARCSSTGALVLIEPVSTVKGGDKPLSPPKTERCSNCSGSGKVGHLEVLTSCLLKSQQKIDKNRKCINQISVLFNIKYDFHMCMLELVGLALC